MHFLVHSPIDYYHHVSCAGECFTTGIRDSSGLRRAEGEISLWKISSLRLSSQWNVVIRLTAETDHRASGKACVARCFWASHGESARGHPELYCSWGFAKPYCVRCLVIGVHVDAVSVPWPLWPPALRIELQLIELLFPLREKIEIFHGCRLFSSALRKISTTLSSLQDCRNLCLNTLLWLSALAIIS